MKSTNRATLAYCLSFFVCACGPGRQPAEPGANAVRADDLVGKWRLIRAGGQAPAERHIKSQEIDISGDGTWTSKIEFGPPERSPDIIAGKGMWSLSGGTLSYRNTPQGLVVRGSGPNSGQSKVRVDSGRLVVDPDFFTQVRKGDTGAAAGEYER